MYDAAVEDYKWALEERIADIARRYTIRPRRATASSARPVLYGDASTRRPSVQQRDGKTVVIAHVRNAHRQATRNACMAGAAGALLATLAALCYGRRAASHAVVSRRNIVHPARKHCTLRHEPR